MDGGGGGGGAGGAGGDGPTSAGGDGGAWSTGFRVAPILQQSVRWQDQLTVTGGDTWRFAGGGGGGGRMHSGIPAG